VVYFIVIIFALFIYYSFFTQTTGGVQMPKGNLIEISFGKSHDQNAQVREPGSGKARQEASVLDFTARNEYAKGAFLQRMNVDMVTVGQGVVAIRFAISAIDRARLRKNLVSVEKYLRRVRAICLSEIDDQNWRVRPDYRVSVQFPEDMEESIRVYFYVEAGADTEQVFSQPKTTLKVAPS
jgi:hypothetical protein